MPQTKVLRLADIPCLHITNLLNRYGLELVVSESDKDIPGSFWGDEEAGLIEHRLYARSDTPIHSILHEASHYVCMDTDRRDGLDTNAGGDYDEENGVCYLQILLSDHIPEMGRQRMWADMDAWGYSFRLGSAQAWFEQDAEDANTWLQSYGVINEAQKISWKLRR